MSDRSTANTSSRTFRISKRNRCAGTPALATGPDRRAPDHCVFSRLATIMLLIRGYFGPLRRPAATIYRARNRRTCLHIWCALQSRIRQHWEVNHPGIQVVWIKLAGFNEPPIKHNGSENYQCRCHNMRLSAAWFSSTFSIDDRCVSRYRRSAE